MRRLLLCCGLWACAPSGSGDGTPPSESSPSGTTPSTGDTGATAPSWTMSVEFRVGDTTTTATCTDPESPTGLAFAAGSTLVASCGPNPDEGAVLQIPVEPGTYTIADLAAMNPGTTALYYVHVVNAAGQWEAPDWEGDVPPNLAEDEIVVSSYDAATNEVSGSAHVVLEDNGVDPVGMLSASFTGVLGTP